MLGGVGMLGLPTLLRSIVKRQDGNRDAMWKGGGPQYSQPLVCNMQPVYAKGRAGGVDWWQEAASKQSKTGLSLKVEP